MSLNIGRRQMPAPTVYPDAKPFWDAAAEGRLLVKRCRDCGEHLFGQTEIGKRH